jgi:hypothetical protein
MKQAIVVLVAIVKVTTFIHLSKRRGYIRQTLPKV